MKYRLPGILCFLALAWAGSVAAADLATPPLVPLLPRLEAHLPTDTGFGPPAAELVRAGLGLPQLALPAAGGNGYTVGGTVQIGTLAGQATSQTALRLEVEPAAGLTATPPALPGRVGLLYLYDTKPGDNPAAGQPLLILPTTPSLAAGDETVRTVGLYADLPLGDKVGVHWAVGYATLSGEDSERGAWEYNVGVAYRVLENLMYEAHFGYLTAGGAESPAPAAADGAGQPPAAVDQVYLITNRISMHF